MAIYLISMYLVSLMFAYVFIFTEEIWRIGRLMCDPEISEEGCHGAITPPWFTYFTIAVWFATLAGIAFGWWHFGWLVGLATTIGFWFIGPLNKRFLLPKSGNPHFLRLILHSMINRQADYLKSGDELRAGAMEYLLDLLRNSAQ